MKILAIETSCDETAVAVLEASGGIKKPKFKILENIISSQIKIHQPFGGVVPSLAKREHTKNLPLIYKKLLRSPAKGGKSYNLKPNLVAVTVGPGLEPALWAGIEFAKALSAKLKKPLIGVNHLEGHLYSSLLPSKSSKNPPDGRQIKAKSLKIIFPTIVLLVSGGHTVLLKMDSLTKWKTLGETRDDAAGEAFDKVARLLKLPYPGGPEIEKLAKIGNPMAIDFPRPMLKDKNYDFSFSGLKTSVLYHLRDNPKENTADMAASFQQSVIDVLVGKTMRAVDNFNAKSVMLCGGVAANKTLRKSLAGASKKYRVGFIVPDMRFNTDNATMIAAAAYMSVLRKKKLPLKANGNLGI
ncbi:MAG: tRNA (adenosine(37)-N6)-threonylcarbamoyltransferase complex transferase subunit TsaD [bacterium]|nr:tRNA (adenosine(37)-N6)-threonylcarbamoyltransferase complex transferase subunit TsaD [bacterium]